MRILRKNRKLHNIFIIVGLLIINYLNNKVEFLRIPESEKMIEYQFNLITVSTVFAGFSFTILGLLIGLNGEKLLKKLEGTSILSRNGRNLFTSVIFFCVSCFISLGFVLNINSFFERCLKKIKISWNIDSLLYIFCISFLVLGIIYFLIAMKGVIQIVYTVYGYDAKKYEYKRNRKDELMDKK